MEPSSGEAFRTRHSDGDVAQLVEHLVCNQGVVGSSPIVSTISFEARENREGQAFKPQARACELEFFDKLGWWNEIVEDLE